MSESYKTAVMIVQSEVETSIGAVYAIRREAWLALSCDISDFPRSNARQFAIVRAAEELLETWLPGYFTPII